MPDAYDTRYVLYRYLFSPAWVVVRMRAWVVVRMTPTFRPTNSCITGGTHDTYVPPKKQLYRRGYPMKSHPAADARQKSIAKKSPTGPLPLAVSLAITPTFRPWTHTSDDSYIYQLPLVVATATVS